MSAVVLAVLAGSYIRNFYPGYGVLIVGAIVAYFGVEFSGRPWNEDRRNLAQFALITFIVSLIVVAPTILQMSLRAQSASYEHIHDGGLQSELAMQFFLSGKTPYGQNYAVTDMGRLFAGDQEYIPWLYHNYYLPLTFILPIPFYLLSQSLFHWFDVRILSLVAFAILWISFPHLTESWDDKRLLWITFGLNPLFVPFFIEGRNDVMVLLWLVLALLALQYKRSRWAALMLAMACATKATAWLVVPFFFIHLWTNRSTIGIRNLLHSVFVFGLGWGLVMLPPALLDFNALVSDALGLGVAVIPIWGYGLSMVMMTLGVITDRRGVFPAAFLQSVFGSVTLLATGWFQWRVRSVRGMVAASAALTFVIFFFSRHFTDNYLGYVLALGLLAYFVEKGKVANGGISAARD